jgi:hypothetical protein
VSVASDLPAFIFSSRSHWPETLNQINKKTLCKASTGWDFE